ncbi:MAG: GAP family protein [Chloroflexota bacterium]|nr:GAP family protein [Chloroflexota bacterium]
MEHIIKEILPFAIGIALSPMAIAAIILMLFTQKARSNSLAFLAGWALGISIVGVVVLALVNVGVSMLGGGSQTIDLGIVKVIFGVLLFVAAAMEWRGRTPKGQEPEMPKWMVAIDKISAGKALGLAIFLSALPKNLMLNVTATTTIANAGLAVGEQIIALFIFIIVANLTIAAIVMLYLFTGERSEKILATWKTWMIVHNSTALTVLYVVYGFILVIPQIISLLDKS